MIVPELKSQDLLKTQSEISANLNGTCNLHATVDKRDDRKGKNLRSPKCHESLEF